MSGAFWGSVPHSGRIRSSNLRGAFNVGNLLIYKMERGKYQSVRRSMSSNFPRSLSSNFPRSLSLPLHRPLRLPANRFGSSSRGWIQIGSEPQEDSINPPLGMANGPSQRCSISKRADSFSSTCGAGGNSDSLTLTLRFRGPCFSACTLIIAVVPKERLCFGDYGAPASPPCLSALRCNFITERVPIRSQ